MHIVSLLWVSKKSQNGLIKLINKQKKVVYQIEFKNYEIWFWIFSKSYFTMI